MLRAKIPAKQLEGIVIRSFPSGERDLVLRVINPLTGKLSLFAPRANGVGGKRGSTVGLFDFGEFQLRLHHDRLSTLISFTPNPKRLSLIGSPEEIAALSVLCECGDTLIPEESEGAWDTLSAYNHFRDGFLAIIESKDDLKGRMRALYWGILNLLLDGGILDPQEKIPPPSAKALVNLFNRIQDISKKPLVTPPTLLSLLKNDLQIKTLSK
ncbi:MAG TPA: recombination protein O N-terminal domain-containing protein [Oligoflexia bacterium]|nr:recombination protein O N-terminal domain-containing protein [Oligoflexia bacterium]HMP26718.1 recombination protein O N-terminal domain-containing protein [Oligoflexia bacterium]